MEVAAQRTRLQELRSCARSGMARIDLTYAARATNRHSIRGRKTARYQRGGEAESETETQTPNGCRASRGGRCRKGESSIAATCRCVADRQPAEIQGSSF